MTNSPDVSPSSARSSSPRPPSDVQETSEAPVWLSGRIISLADRISIAAGSQDLTSLDPRYAELDAGPFLEYIPYGRDFGPVNISAVTRFSETMRTKLLRRKHQTVVLRCREEAGACANAVMLVGAHLILQGRCKDAMPDLSEAAREGLDALPAYRDICSGAGSLELRIEDVWAGLWRAKELGWIAAEGRGEEELDLEEYEHYDYPYNGDLHRVVPRKLIALKAPADFMGELDWWDNNYVRVFHPRYMGELLGDMGVTRVVRLSKEPTYSKETLEDRGIEVVDLHDEDWEAPSLEAVRRLAEAVNGADGAVAVHCKNGLGKTGTAAAAYVMWTYGMRAREAMGWVRLVRPGSVIGRQQEGLEQLEVALRRESARW